MRKANRIFNFSDPKATGYHSNQYAIMSTLPPPMPLLPIQIIHCTTSTTCTQSSIGHLSRRRVLYSSNLSQGSIFRSQRRGRLSQASPPTAGELFSIGTAAVLPFYILMVAAPKSRL
ncbi:hypothetical protein LINGRAHAP2_LOCUS35087, partial [Linum grandiflorum]